MAADDGGFSSKSVTIVIVTFNSASVLPACLQSLPKTRHLIIVDNASSDDTAELARKLAPDAVLLIQPRNEGFGPAANIGFKLARSEFGLLLNADVQLAPDMIEKLVDAARLYPDAGMMAPTATENGKVFFGRTLFFGGKKARKSLIDALPEGDICCDYVGGSAMFFKMAAFRHIGGFDDALFLFYEDDDICLRMRREGYALIQIHDAKLDHLSGKSTSTITNLEYWKQFHMAWSRMHVERKYRGLLGAGSYLIREGTSCLVKYLARPGDKRRTRYAGRLAGLRAFVTGVRSRDVAVK